MRGGSRTALYKEVAEYAVVVITELGPSPANVIRDRFFFSTDTLLSTKEISAAIRMFGGDRIRFRKMTLAENRSGSGRNSTRETKMYELVEE